MSNEEFQNVSLQELKDWTNTPEPKPILWHDKETRYADAVLSEGEVALLSGPGGLGKSSVSLAVAHVAVHAHLLNQDYGAACGLRVAAGKVLLVSYEDAPVRIASRVKGMPGGIPDGLFVWENPSPLWKKEGKGEAWDELWQSVSTDGIKAKLVIIDPASAALVDVEVSEGGPVRAFLTECRIMAETHKCGVLIVAHDTKAARNEARQGGDPGAGAVAGSATWYDAARGVLYLRSASADKRVDDDPDARVLECLKANYGRTGWKVNLVERFDNGRFAGLEKKESEIPDEDL